MIKAKVIKPFYCAVDKELYLDEERYKELLAEGYIEEVKEITKAVVKNKKIEKATNDKRRVLSNQIMEEH